jgi:hypothetical protein
MSFLSSSVSAGSTEYRYLVDFGGETKAALARTGREQCGRKYDGESYEPHHGAGFCL